MNIKNQVRENRYSLYFLLFFTVFFTAIAGLVSIHIATKYYASYCFHYDSASYLYTSLYFANQLKIESFYQVLYTALSNKDGLDVILRIVFFPGSLDKLFGHMYILLPFMASFIFLLMFYIYRRTNRLILAILSVSFLFAFSLMYSPYLGISDYWKGNLGVWLMGDVLVCLLISEFLTKQFWNLGASIFLGLLFWQRSALAIYALMFLTPYILFSIFFQLKNDKFVKCIKRLLYFIIPFVFFAVTLAFFQWQLLYKYYFIGGYAYGSYMETLNSIIIILKQVIYIPFITTIMLSIAVFCLFYNKENKDFFVAFWFLVGFILSVILIKGMYEEAANILWMLSVILVTTALQNLTGSKYVIFGNLIIIALFVSIICYSTHLFLFFNQTPNFYGDASLSRWKQVFSSIAMEVTKRNVHFFAILSDENNVPLLEQIRFNSNIDIFSPSGVIGVGFMAQHDSYYYSKLNLKVVNVSKIADENIKTLQKLKNVIAVTYCSPSEVKASPAFGPDGQKVAVPYALANLNIIQKSKDWKKIKMIDSPFGCLAMYWYNSKK